MFETEINIISTIIFVASPLWFFWRRRNTGMVYVIHKRNRAYYVQYKVRVKLKKEFVTLGEHTYHLDWQLASFIKDQTAHLIFNEGNGQPIQIMEPKIKEDSRKLKLIVKQKIVEQLVRATGTRMDAFALMLVIVALVAGVGIGFMLRTFIPTPVPVTNATTTGPPVYVPP